jgi:hypothetical protein
MQISRRPPNESHYDQSAAEKDEHIRWESEQPTGFSHTTQVGQHDQYDHAHADKHPVAVWVEGLTARYCREGGQYRGDS